MSKPADVGTLKVGSYLLLDGEPCKIVGLSKSKPGKHGSAKARIVAIGVFDKVKRSIVKPVSAQIEIPMIDKRPGQTIAILQSAVQIMDLETYEVFEAAFPEDENIRSKLESGSEIEYWRILGRTKITRVKT